jgi:hypothetical protein
MADTVENVFLGGWSKFLEAAGALIRERAGGLYLPKHQLNERLPLILLDAFSRPFSGVFQQYRRYPVIFVGTQ